MHRFRLLSGSLVSQDPHQAYSSDPPDFLQLSFLKTFWSFLLTLLPLLFLILIGTNSSWAAEVDLAWDAVTPAPDGYNLYLRESGTTYDYSRPIWRGLEPNCTLTGLSDGTLYHFVVRAYVGSDESGDSNEVSYQTPAAAAQTPPAVVNQTYYIEAWTGSNGTITPSGTASVTANDSMNYTITPDTGYHVADVLMDGTSVGAVSSYTFNQVSANHTLMAIFDINTYAIAASTGGNGTITPAGTAGVAYGGSQTYTITPAPCHRLVDVVVDGVSVGAVTRYTFNQVGANHTIRAIFTANSYIITASGGANGRVTPSGTVSVTCGSTNNYAITPDSNYHVSDVWIDGHSVGAVTGYTFNDISANHTLAASFVKSNQAPVANAGADQTVPPQGVVTLDGSGSYDPDGDSLSYRWTQTAGEPVALTAAQSTRPSFSAPLGTASSTITLSFRLAVSDPNGQVGSDTCQVVVKTTDTPNTSPVAEAGPNQVVTTGSAVTLNGSASYDPDGKALSCQWTQTSGTAVQLSAANILKPTFSAPAVAPGTSELLVFELKVVDDRSATASDTCVVQVDPPQAVDTDADGVPDQQDAFPYDNGEWADNDRDGVGDQADLDDDNDGMPDIWEMEHGLNPLVDDSALDPDGDGVNNLAEFQSGNDPSRWNGNQPPATPQIAYPADNATTICLTPVLKSSDFYDPDPGDTFAQFEWLIRTQSDQSIVFHTLRKYKNSPDLKVPRLVLKPDTTYSCQVRYHDSHRLASSWSPATTFTTAAGSAGGSKRLRSDMGITGVLVTQGGTDLNANNIPDDEETQAIQTLQSLGEQAVIGVGIEENSGNLLDGALIIDPGTEETESLTLDLSAYDLFTYRLLVGTAGESAAVTRYRSSGISVESGWICLDSSGVWSDCTTENYPGGDASAVDRTIQDGGPEDVDGVANGVAIVVTGVQKSAASPVAAHQGLASADGEGAESTEFEHLGCFIGTMMSTDMNQAK